MLPIVLVPAVSAGVVALTGLLVAYFAQAGVRNPWITAAAWVVPEALRGVFPLGGLPWGELGAALHDVPAARALASIGGVPLVSFVLVVVNALVLDLALALRTRTRTRAARATTALAVVLLVAGVASAARRGNSQG